MLNDSNVRKVYSKPKLVSRFEHLWLYIKQDPEHEWVQKYLAARIAQNAQTIRPSKEDLIRAYMLYGEARRKANQDYEKAYGNDEESGWGDDHRWVRRD